LIQAKKWLGKEGLERRGNLRQGRPYHNTEILSELAAGIKNSPPLPRSRYARSKTPSENTAETSNPKGPLPLRQAEAHDSAIRGSNVNNGEGYGAVFSLTIPEPSALALLGIGAAGLLFYALRRRMRGTR
jgi:hypothetical protein